MFRGVGGRTKGRSRGDLGKIHRSKGFGVQGCRRKFREGEMREGVGTRARGGLGGGGGKGEIRTIESGGVLGSEVRNIEGRWMSNGEGRGRLRSEEKRKRNTICICFRLSLMGTGACQL